VGQVLHSSTTGHTYEVLEVKKGGFGAVYIVRKEDSGELYAPKTFQARYLWSDEDRERFEREAITWVMLDHHPNIVTARWVERIEGSPCLVLEYVHGGDLAQLLQKGSLPVERALELALQFCDGMAYAHHKLGIVRRDVKPSNCLLAKNGPLKVTDFGLARTFGQAQEEALGLSGLGLGVKTQYTMPLGTLD
jgi:serine/threonine protein kinase